MCRNRFFKSGPIYLSCNPIGNVSPNARASSAASNAVTSVTIRSHAAGTLAMRSASTTRARTPSSRLRVRSAVKRASWAAAKAALSTCFKSKSSSRVSHSSACSGGTVLWPLPYRGTRAPSRPSAQAHGPPEVLGELSRSMIHPPRRLFCAGSKCSSEAAVRTISSKPSG